MLLLLVAWCWRVGVISYNFLPQLYEDYTYPSNVIASCGNMSVAEYYLTKLYTDIIWQLLTFKTETSILQVVGVTRCLVSALTVMYCLVPINWNLLVRKWVKQEGGAGYEAGTQFMALDVSEKYRSQIHWPLEHLEISVAFRRPKQGELCNVFCMCTYNFCEYLVCECIFLCVCVECKIHCLPYSIKLFILRAWKLQQMLLRHVTRKQGRNYY